MDTNNFIYQIIKDDVRKHGAPITRFPPEPNGFLHLGHVKSICLNFGLAQEFGGQCNLRFDDTNPNTEEQAYIDAIQEDVRWLGFDWAGDVRYTSNYFEVLFDLACRLIEKGLAYVDLQTPDEIKTNRGGFGIPGIDSPQRNASIDQNMTRFMDMRAGKYADGKAILRAKIDMTSSNMNMRDPVLYRVLHARHHQSKDAWCIYPMYDYAHPLSDALEGISHSICTLEFEDHRPLYDWLVDHLRPHLPARPHQYEFARLNVAHVLTSKRKLKKLVDEHVVSGWDDPRMPTVAGMRARGYTKEGLRDFCHRVGVTKSDGVVDFELLEFCIRQSIEDAWRAMAVLDPLEIEITNFDEAMRDVQTLKKPSVKAHLDNGVLWLDQSSDDMTRKIPFTRHLVIERNDYMQNPPQDFRRLCPQNPEIRLRNSYVLKVNEVMCDDKGAPKKLLATIDPQTLGNNPQGRKVKGVIHWVSKSHGKRTVVHEFDKLFLQKDPAQIDLNQLNDAVNPHSKKTHNAYIEPMLFEAVQGTRFQFERLGYFIACGQTDTGAPIFNQIVGLKDSYKPVQ